MEYYMIHDNMDRPFKVTITKNKIKIYKHKPYTGDSSDFDEDDIEQYNVLIMTIENYISVFIGEDPEYEEFKGNNILVHIGEKNKINKYIMIDGRIYSFKIKEKILDFKSPVGNSDVPYSYAIGEKNTYLMTFNQYIPNDVIKEGDDPHERCYEKYVKSFDAKIIHKRDT
jgi:hypothetical protein